jgi:hypothetical protein
VVAKLPRTLTILACLAVAALLVVRPSAAEHEIYYRFTVLGYLKDPMGKPRPDVDIQLVREKTGFSYAGRTDASGLYVVIVRLGDESVGESLRLRAGGDSVAIVARFDPGDHGRERGTRVDFHGGLAVEQPAAFAATLKTFLAQ